MKRFLRINLTGQDATIAKSTDLESNNSKKPKTINSASANTIIVIEDDTDEGGSDHDSNNCNTHILPHQDLIEISDSENEPKKDIGTIPPSAFTVLMSKQPSSALSSSMMSPPYLGVDPKLFINAGFTVEYLSEYTWIAMRKKFWTTPSSELFNQVWNNHPLDHAIIKMFGKDVPVPRYQQAYGRSYQFSGAISNSIEETDYIREMKETLNRILKRQYPMDSVSNNVASIYDHEFNMCFCNWYEPHHYIGPHADDERQLYSNSPIASITWGAPRTFVLTAIKNRGKPKVIQRKEIVLEDGDCLIMGGTCQKTHKHEILKLKKNQVRGNRINFTFRCFQ